jgi:hypothetical protein
MSRPPGEDRADVQRCLRESRDYLRAHPVCEERGCSKSAAVVTRAAAGSSSLRVAALCADHARARRPALQPCVKRSEASSAREDALRILRDTPDHLAPFRKPKRA